MPSLLSSIVYISILSLLIPFLSSLEATSTMTPLARIRAANVQTGSSLPSRPVAVFVGGTSGIGAAMAHAFAEHRAGDAHVVLVGRNRTAADALLAALPQSEAATYEFVECDVALMRNVRRTAAELAQRLPKLNFLVLSPGILTMQGRTETEEGIDRKLALHYYARWRFTYDLIPLLQKAKDAGEDAKVMSVLSGGVDGREIDLDDLGLKKGYTLPAAARHASVYNDCMVQSFAEKHPELAFTHSAPGVVRTPIFDGIAQAHWAGRLLAPLAHGLGRVVGVAPDECAAYMWRGLYAGEKGWFRRDRHGEDVGAKNMWSPPGAKEKIWEHTLAETSK